MIPYLGQRFKPHPKNNTNDAKPIMSKSYIQPQFNKGSKTIDIGPLWCMGPGLYDWKLISSPHG
jgi:hypothetical protein